MKTDGSESFARAASIIGSALTQSGHQLMPFDGFFVPVNKIKRFDPVFENLVKISSNSDGSLQLILNAIAVLITDELTLTPKRR